MRKNVNRYNIVVCLGVLIFKSGLCSMQEVYEMSYSYTLCYNYQKLCLKLS